MKPLGKDTPVAKVVFSFLLLLLIGGGLVLLWRSRRMVEQAPPPVEGIGKVEYERRLRELGGTGLGTDQLARLAWSEYCRIEERLDELAASLEPGKGWKEVFARLRTEHPATPEGVLEAYRREVDRAIAFVEDRDLVTLPPGRLEVLETPDVLPKENYPLAAYLGYKLVVTTSLGGRRSGRGDYLRNHCDICIPPLVVHEAVPGHHVCFLHTRQPKEFPTPAVQARAQENAKNKFFYEGWAQYGERLMIEEGYYQEPAQELGAWRMLLLRALRAWVDPLLHTGELGVEEAASLLEENLLMSREAAEAEVRRHLVEPAMKASYYVGMVQILALREELERQTPDFDVKDFHDRLLQWPLPIPEIAQINFGVEIGDLGAGEEGLLGGAEAASSPWSCGSG